jgi:hypothetical protein
VKVKKNIDENFFFIETFVRALHKQTILQCQGIIRSQKQPPIMFAVYQNEGKLETIFLKKYVKSTVSVLNQRRKLQITVLKTAPRSMLHSGIPIQELFTILE